MDDARFDALAKRLAGGVTRRGLLRGLAGLTGGGVAALLGRSVSEASDCGSRCGSLPAGSARDKCLVACQASAAADAKAAAARATAAAARARADALRACRGDERRLCGSGAAVACCAIDEACQDGRCVHRLGCEACGPGEDCCNGTCVNLQTDAQNCGACNDVCGAGQVCDGGVCCVPATCPAGQCGTQPDGCGGSLECSCAPGQVCKGSACCAPATCQAGQCGNQPDGCGGVIHCGACGAGQTCCAGICANLETDAAHCGACSHACPTGQSCCGGACAELCFTESGEIGCCAAGQACCGSVCCADGNCCGGGDCCQAGQVCCGSACCPAGLSCCGGVECCETKSCCESAGTCCPTGYLCCGDQCTQENDTDNCGICDNTCAPGQVCLGAAGCCTPGTCAGRCGTVSDGCGGSLDCGDCPTGQCQTCDAPSGACVTTCAPGQVCNQGSCCTPATCQAKQCGSYSDGCGGTVDCGTCANNETCVNNGCFIAGNSDTCSFSTDNDCPCSSDQDCCSCSNGFAGTDLHICWRSAPDPATIDCFNGNADCPVGWVCLSDGQPPTCLPPC